MNSLDRHQKALNFAKVRLVDYCHGCFNHATICDCRDCALIRATVRDVVTLTDHSPDRCGVARGGLWVSDCIRAWPCSQVSSLLDEYGPQETPTSPIEG